MGYISIKITDIQIPNDFRVYVKPDGGLSKPYPIIGNTWTDYGALADTPIYSGGTTEIWLTGSTYDFQYGTTYWVKLEESEYTDRYVIKNIRIFDSVAYQGAAPLPSPTMSMSPPSSVTPSVTRTSTVTPTPTPSYLPVTPSKTPTPTPSLSISSSVGASQTPTPTQTPSVTPTNAISEIYFASLIGETGIMGVNNPVGRTFAITFNYHLNANCDNVYTNGQGPCQATTYLFYSINNGGTWNEVNYVTAEVPGGTYPVADSDSQDLYGTFTLTGITDVTQVRIQGQYDCVWSQDSKGGSVDVTITGVTVNTGTAVIICNNTYHIACLDVANLSCAGPPVTPSVTPTVSRTVTRTPSVSPEVIKVLVYNNSGNYTSITDVWVGGTPLFDMSPEFPLYPGDNALGRSRWGTGTYTVMIYLYGTDPTTKKMTLIDSSGYEHCKNITPGATNISFTGVQLNTTGWPDPYAYYGNVSMIIEFFNSGLCPSPPPQTPTRTPTTTPSISLSPTPGLSPSVTPTTTPVAFGYSIEMFQCIGTACGSSIGTAIIQNSDYLTVGEYYATDYDVVYRIIGPTSLGGDVTNVTGPGYASCNDACNAMPS